LKKSKLLTVLGVMVLLLVVVVSISFGDSKYLDAEYEVQKQVIDTFDLKVNDLKSKNLRPLFMRDIYDDEIAKEDHETRIKVAMAISTLMQDKEIAEGDFKPMIFLDNNNKALIAVKHSDNSITLNEFDISNKEPVKVSKQIKEIKVDKEEKINE